MPDEPIHVGSFGELVAAVPMVLGTHVEDSLVVFPVNATDVPVARIDLPTIDDHREIVAAHLKTVYADVSAPVVLIAYTDDPYLAAAACAPVADALKDTCPVHAVIHVEDQHWQRLDGRERGVVTAGERDRFTAESILRTGRSPYPSQADLEASFRGSPHAIPEPLMTAAMSRAATVVTRPEVKDREKTWMRETIERAVTSRRLLPDADAARLLADIQDLSLRDHAWAGIDRDRAREHAEHWKQLLTRAPEELKAPAATLAAFSYWVCGDGLSARAALGSIPDEQDYCLARLMRTVLATGMDPRTFPIPNELPQITEPDPAPPPTPGKPTRESQAPTTGRDRPGPGITR